MFILNLHSKLVILLAKILIEAAGNKWQTLSLALADDDEPQVLEVRCKIVGDSGQVQHYSPVSTLAKADQLIVLSDDLRRSAGEVECEGSLISTEVVDVEDQLLREILGITPDHPANTRVDKTILVTRDVDGCDLLKTEIPEQVRVDERSNEATGSGIDVDVDINITLNQEIVDSLCVLVLAGVCGTQNGADTDGVLVDKVNGLLGVDYVAVLGAVNVLLLDIEVSASFLHTVLASSISQMGLN